MKENPQTVQDIVARLRSATEEEFLVIERALKADTRVSVVRALEAARKRIAAQKREEDRLAALYAFDAQQSAGVVLGLDEVGRGPLAGPLAVGGVVLGHEDHIAGLNDSKKVPRAKRESIAECIKQQSRAHTVVFIEPAEIDAHGMSACLRRAFLQAISNIEACGIVPDCILLDGNPMRLDPREVNVIKGDAQSASIAAASILAKVTRDTLMCDYAKQYPEYGFEKNMGYASEFHCNAIREHGLSPIHRASFCSAFLQESLF